MANASPSAALLLPIFPGKKSSSRWKNTTRSATFFASFAARLARQVPVPVILTGGNRRFDVMERLAREDNIAAFGLCRPLICEPDLVNRWHEDLAARPRCVSCNGCNNTPGHRCILPPRA